ncbi:MAG: ribosome biogenesis GTP-binding protein YihA/YsxC [Thermodesulfobacteriota bacterium]
MKIKSAVFLGSAEHRDHYPESGLREVAFAGRSNVGKSSMINTLVGRRGLVRTSKTPGLTRKLNFFEVNKELVFVDLPGYGYAKVPIHVKKQWGPMIRSYIEEREALAGIVVILDCRHPPTDSDIQLVDFLTAHNVPLILAATKADKLSYGRTLNARKSIETKVGANNPVILFSSITGLGKKELWKEIKTLIGTRGEGNNSAVMNRNRKSLQAGSVPGIPDEGPPPRAAHGNREGIVAESHDMVE